MGFPSKEDAHARNEWEERIGQRSSEAIQGNRENDIPPPERLVAESGAGQITLRWQLVDNAAGYLVHRSESREGPFTPIDHGGGDVLAVPGPAYADTTGKPGTHYWYAVASIRDATYPAGKLSLPVQASPKADAAAHLQLRVQTKKNAGKIDPVWHMLGSEHLSQLFYGAGPGGSHIGEEFQSALRMARTELGAEHIRAHAILHDEQGVYQEVNGEANYNFAAVDQIFDRLLHAGPRPVVEISFMPRDLAKEPDAKVFAYGGIISPPCNWDRWRDLNFNLASHLVQRYGIEEVSQWGFEIWNEPNLKVFWTGTQNEYFQLYDIAARAIKAVDDRLLVGGPSTAAAEWIADFLNFVRQQDSPLDFISTHTYGNMPLDIGQTLKIFGFENVKIWWTEWGVTPTHFAPVNDSAFGAPFILHGMKSSQGRADYLAYWVVSDHFEELGQAPRLLHGGFGLLTSGNLRKPRYWALALAESLGRELVNLDLQGDGAGSLVDAWASRKPDGTIAVLVWNGTLDQSKIDGSDLLKRQINVRIEQLEDRGYQVVLARIDSLHSNIATCWKSENNWPTPEQWEWLHTVNTLDEQAMPDILPVNGTAQVTFGLPMPGVVRLRLKPR